MLLILHFSHWVLFILIKVLIWFGTVRKKIKPCGIRVLLTLISRFLTVFYNLLWNLQCHQYINISLWMCMYMWNMQCKNITLLIFTLKIKKHIFCPLTVLLITNHWTIKDHSCISFVFLGWSISRSLSFLEEELKKFIKTSK